MNISYLGLPNLLAEEAVGAEKEEDEKDEEGDGILPLRGYLPDPKVLCKGDEEAAERCPWNGPNTPTITATTPIMSAFMPIVGVMSTSKEMRSPAIPARKEPSKNAERIVRSVSIPVTRERSGSEATARMAVPIFENFIKTEQAIRRIMLTMIIPIWTGVILAPSFLYPVCPREINDVKHKEKPKKNQGNIPYFLTPNPKYH
jgi:hypothetical protein